MQKKTTIAVKDYRVLFENDKYPASSACCLYHDGRLFMTIQRASDAEKGLSSLLTESSDMGKRWSTPVPIGPVLKNLSTEFQRVRLMHVLPNKTIVAAGIHLPNGYDASKGLKGVLRSCEILIGFKTPNQRDFVWERHASGTFLGEQFIGTGIMLESGRIVFTLWGSKIQNENWQCGVLLSDDGARTLRYRQVGYEADLSIRKNPEMVAGYNEQTLFGLSNDEIVSIIRGRDFLGEIQGASLSSSECLFSRSVSTDGGEIWSKPELTNLPGTGACSAGLVLADGSLLLPARIPTVWSRYDDYSLCGLHMARSFDKGKTWETEFVFHHDPDGNPYNNYYNAMNGNFVPISDSEVLYVFGHFRPKEEKGHVVNVIHLSLNGEKL